LLLHAVTPLVPYAELILPHIGSYDKKGRLAPLHLRRQEERVRMTVPTLTKKVV